MAETAVDEAEDLLARYATFRQMGFDELDAQALARSGVAVSEVRALLRKKCPMRLVAQILA
jgi:lactate dehydrogenase-like 2-hydroxyacid dehydrogenase